MKKQKKGKNDNSVPHITYLPQETHIELKSGFPKWGYSCMSDFIVDAVKEKIAKAKVKK